MDLIERYPGDVYVNCGRSTVRDRSECNVTGLAGQSNQCSLQPRFFDDLPANPHIVEKSFGRIESAWELSYINAFSLPANGHAAQHNLIGHSLDRGSFDRG